MGQVKIHVQSFNSGELSETMASRFGVEKVASGCRLLRNFLPHIHGPAEKRPGMERLGYASSTTVAPRLLEFNFSATTRFAIEFAPGVLRFWSNGALVTTLSTVSHPYTPDETFEIHAKQVNDVVYLVHPNHQPHKLTRLADNNWTLAPVAFKYPALLDEYYETESAAAPTLTEFHSVPLSEAQEFAVALDRTETIPSFIATPSGAVDSAWFELNWTWASALADAAASAATLTLQVVNQAGDWADAGTVTLSTTSTAPANTQWSFHPTPSPDTSLTVRRRTFSGGSWGAWGTVVVVPLVNVAGTTAAAMPKLQFRLVYGPLTLEGSSGHRVKVVPVTAVEGDLFNYSLRNVPYAFIGTPELPLITVHTAERSGIYSPQLQNMPATISAGHTAKFQFWTGSAWATVGTVVLTSGMADTGFGAHRLRVDGSNVVIEKRTEPTAGRYVWTNVSTIAGTTLTGWEWRLWTSLEGAPGATIYVGLSRFDGATFSPYMLFFGRTLSKEYDGSGGVVMPAGELWQFRAEIGDNATIPAGAVLYLQKKANGSWVNIKTWSITSGTEVMDYDATATPFTADTTLRIYYASTSGQRIEATAAIETVVYPASSAITLSVNATNGTGRTMTASSALFQADHVGSFWQISHRLDTAYTEVIGVVGAFPASKLVSKTIRVFGQWDFYSYGTWKGKVFLERKTASQAWEVLRVWTSNNDRNIVANGEASNDQEMRIRIQSGMVGTAASGAAVPRFLLEAADARNYGLVKVTDYTSSTEVEVEVVRTLASVDATTLWAEGAWSDVRGYPSAIATHEGRLWFGGTSHQPSTIWGSVSNDFENFRRSTLDDGSIVASIAAESANFIRWLAPASDALFVGTGGEEWAIFSNTEGQPLTPTNLKARPRGAYSSSILQPRRLQDALMFVQRDSRRIRRADFDQSTGEFLASDVTVLAPHVSDSGLKQLAVSQSPQAIIWAVTNDGRLVSLTFEREQNVFAWALHETDGLVQSVCVLTGESTDEVWLSTERNGRAHIERLDPVAMLQGSDDWETMLYSDCSVRFGAGSTVNVPHLTSRNVVGLVDGVPFTATVNGSGVLTLPTAAVTGGSVGLPFTAQLQPMRLEIPLQDGSSQTRQFKVARVGVRVIDSRSGQVADATDGVFETLPYTHGAGLFTGMVETAITARTMDNANVCVKDSTPLPFMVGGLVLDLDVYGD